MRENPSTDNEILEKFIKSSRFKDIIKSILPRFEGIKSRGKDPVIKKEDFEEYFLKLLDGKEVSGEEIDKLIKGFSDNEGFGTFGSFLNETLENQDYLLFGVDIKLEETNLRQDGYQDFKVINKLEFLKFSIINKIKLYLLKLLKKIQLDTLINSTKSSIVGLLSEEKNLPFFSSKYYSLYISLSGKIYLASNNKLDFETQEIDKSNIFIYGSGKRTDYFCIIGESTVISLKNGVYIGQFKGYNKQSSNIKVKTSENPSIPLLDFKISLINSKAPIPLKKAS